MGPQQVVIETRVAHRPLAQDGLQAFAPGTVTGGVHHQPVRRGIVVRRDLDGEPAARRDETGKAREQRVVAVEPLQRRVRVEDVDRLARVPFGDVGLDPGVRMRRRAGAVQHLRRVVDAGDPRLRPALAQQPGDVARPAAEIHDQSRRWRGNTGQQLRRRPQPVVLEGEILVRIPLHRATGAHFFRLRSQRSNSLVQASSDWTGA